MGAPQAQVKIRMTYSSSVSAGLCSEKFVFLGFIDGRPDFSMLVQPSGRLIGVELIFPRRHSMTIDLIQIVKLCRIQPEQPQQVACLDTCNSAFFDETGSIFTNAKETAFNESAVHVGARTFWVNSAQVFDHAA